MKATAINRKPARYMLGVLVTVLGVAGTVQYVNAGSGCDCKNTKYLACSEGQTSDCSVYTKQIDCSLWSARSTIHDVLRCVSDENGTDKECFSEGAQTCETRTDCKWQNGLCVSKGTSWDTTIPLEYSLTPCDF